ncbi:MFS transporter [Micrococcus luteus]
MDFGAYSRLLKDSRIRNLLGVGFIARFPHSAAGVILTFHVAVTMGLGYGTAGIGVAAMTLGIAVGAPWRGRVIDTKGLRRALIPSVIGEALIWPIVPFLPFPLMLAAVFVGGMLVVPVFSVVRQGLGVLAQGRERQTAFALDSIITEGVFIIGPTLGGIVAAMGSSALGLVIVGLSGALGGGLLMWFNPPTRTSQVEAGPQRQDAYTQEEDREQAIAQAVTGAPMHLDMAAADLATGAIPVVTSAIPAVTGALPVITADGSGPVTPSPQARRAGRAERLRQWRRNSFGWMNPASVAVLLVAVGAGFALIGTEVTIMATLERQDQAAYVGVVFALWCGASAVGGILYGATHRDVSPTVLIGLLGVASIPMALAWDLWSLALLSIPSGLLTAPTLAAASSLLSRLVPEHRRGEAMGFYGSSMTAGSAAGAPLCGQAIETFGPQAGFYLAAIVAFVSALLSVVLSLRARRQGIHGEY